MSNPSRFLLLATIVAFCLPLAHAQPVLPSRMEGRPLFSRSIPWTEYEAHNQNWAIAQRPNGLVYVANSEGILEFDGAKWRTIHPPSHLRPLIRSVQPGAGGRLFVGGSGTIGYLAPDSSHTLVYRSLDERVPAANRAFTDVWTTHSTDQGIVFQASEQLMRWNGRRMQVWTTPSRFRTAFNVEGVVHVWEEGVGIKRLGATKLELIPGGERFAERKVDSVLPHRNGTLVIVRDEGLVLLRRGEEANLGGSGSEYLRSFRPYAAVRVRNAYSPGIDLYAVSTFGGGVALIDGSGALVRVYREDVGLSEGSQATGLLADAQGGLWVAQMNGINRIDLFPRHTWFAESDGLMGSAYAVVLARQRLFVGTASGLFALQPGTLGRPGTALQAYSRFDRVTGIPEGPVWAILDTPQGLLVGTSGGLFVLEEGKRPRRLTDGITFSLYRLPSRPDVAFAGQKGGALRLGLVDGRWQATSAVSEVDGEIRWMLEPRPGELWMAEPAGRLFRLRVTASESRLVRTFGPDSGLPTGAGGLSIDRGIVRMVLREGVFQVSLVGDQLILKREPSLPGLSGIYGLFNGGNAINAWITADGRFRARSMPGRPLTDAAFELGGLQASDIFEERRGVVWVAAADGLLRYDSRVSVGERSYPAFVRRVTDRQRRTLHGGANTSVSAGEPQLTIGYSDLDELRFEFSAAFFDREEGVEYQTRLEGRFDDWSAWSPERSTGFSQLFEGTYTFHVRARDDQGRMSEEAFFVVRILPPWYRTIWAYATYFLLALAIIWGFSAWRLYKHRLKLEAQRAHGARLERLSGRLRETNVRLREADKLKDDLLSNTSHELRTPLTAILGFSEMLLMEIGEEQRMLAEGIQRGGLRLLDTVNGLLDMFKLQSGTLEIQTAEVDAAQTVRDCVRRMEIHADKANLTLTVRPEASALMANLDADAFCRILTNLVDNAIKFTEEGGVTVLLDGDDESIYLTVKDTGIGIPAADIERVFRPFEQVSTGYSRSHEGTGLGLAIVERVASLVGGFVTLESREGVGTTVRVTVPRWPDLTVEGRPMDAVSDGTTLAGLHLLAVGFDERLLGSISSRIEPQGNVHAVATPALAIRDARKLAYDVVALPASNPEEEVRAVRLIRGTPGYADLPILRIGGEQVGEEQLLERGFTHHVPTPLESAAFVGLLEALLMHVALPTDA